MKKVRSKARKLEPDEMLPEYDFRRMKGGVRGKYYQAYRAGHTVTVREADGTTRVQHFKVEDGAVILERDVREYFPDAESVNSALRCLIPLIRKRRKAEKKEPAASNRP
jgi:hypothetical protein